MTTYNFDKIVNRRGTSSIKWDLFGDDVLPLWVADMDFPTHAAIISAMASRLEHPFFGYQSPDSEVFDVICDWVAAHHNWSIKSDHILLIPGIVSGFNWVAETFVGIGESVAFQTPVYFPFYKLAENNDINQIEIPFVKSSSGYETDFDQFESLVNDGTRMFLLCNPHNPIGKVFSVEELERIGEICLKHNILICSDEIHCDLVYPGGKHVPIAALSPELSQNTITLMAPSKTFNIPGLQFSFAICKNRELRERLEKGRRGILEKPGILSQVAAKTAYQYGAEWLQDLLVYLEVNRNYLIDFLDGHIPQIEIHPPEGTYLAWLDCSELNLQPSPFQFFLELAKIAMNDGKMFGKGGSQFVRLNFACPRAFLTEALESMAFAIKNHRE